MFVRLCIIASLVAMHIVKCEADSNTPFKIVSRIENRFSDNCKPGKILARVQSSSQSGRMLSDTVTFSFRVIKGANFCQLRDPYNKEPDSVVQGVEHMFGYLRTIFFYRIGGNTLRDTLRAVVRICASDTSVQAEEIELAFPPSEYTIMKSTPTLRSGDAAAFFVKHVKPDGTLEDPPPAQFFHIELIGGPKGALISSPYIDQPSSYLKSVPAYGLRLLVPQRIEEERSTILICVCPCQCDNTENSK